MKVNPDLFKLKNHGVPKEKIEDYARYMGGICSIIGGSSKVMEYSIEHIVEKGIRGDEAVKYIENQLDKWEESLNDGLIYRLSQD